MSQSRLAFAMYDVDQEEGRGYDASFIARVERGERRPPYRFMLLLGRALDPTFTEFPEYHLAMARRDLDEAEVGLETAVLRLSDLGLVPLDRELEDSRQDLVDDVLEGGEPKPAPETPREKDDEGETKRGVA